MPALAPRAEKDNPRKLLAAVLRLFVEAQGSSNIPREIYKPPWRLSPRGPEYGPSAARYRELQARWRESILGGGLWDHAEDARLGPRVEPPPRSKHGPGPLGDLGGDHVERMHRAYEHTGARWPAQEVEIYAHVYCSGRTLADAAARMGLSHAAARHALHRLRKRLAQSRIIRG